MPFKIDFKRPSLWFLIVVNLFPVWGALAWNWNLSSLIFFYWFENVVIGVLNIFKMLLAQEGAFKANPWVFWPSKIFTVLFFTVHYGMFCFGHGVFVFALFGQPVWTFKLILMVLIGTVLSHGFSFVHNYIGNKEYQKTSVDQLMMAPYGRIVVVHLTIIFGAFLSLAFKNSLGAYLLLVLFKTPVDAFFHLKEREKPISLFKLQPKIKQPND